MLNIGICWQLKVYTWIFLIGFGYLGVLNTIKEYRMNGKLPYYRIGGKILYKEQDIIEILERNKVLAFE